MRPASLARDEPREGLVEEGNHKPKSTGARPNTGPNRPRITLTPLSAIAAVQEAEHAVLDAVLARYDANTLADTS